jgi:3'(2'), 5'-bisphosphate nucleotidase
MGKSVEMPEFSFAVDISRCAGLLARRIRGELGLMRLTKQDMSPVTVADFALQAVVAESLARVFPNDKLVAEESTRELQKSPDVLQAVTHFVSTVVPGADAGSVRDFIDRGCGEPAGRFWVLDPIDGTKGYIRGDQYAMALALIEGGQVRVATLACPSLPADLRTDIVGNGVIAAAARGKGAWIAALEPGEEFRRLRVSDVFEPAEQTENLAGMLGVTAAPVRLDSQAKFVILAGGNAEVQLRLLSPDRPDYKEKIWDIAAGSLVTEEAGGRVTDLDGRALDFTAGRTLQRNRGILATNKKVHDAVLDAIVALRI